MPRPRSETAIPSMRPSPLDDMSRTEGSLYPKSSFVRNPEGSGWTPEGMSANPHLTLDRLSGSEGTGAVALFNRCPRFVGENGGCLSAWFIEAIDPEEREFVSNLRPVSYRGRQLESGKGADTDRPWGDPSNLPPRAGATSRSFWVRSPCHGLAIRHEFDERGRSVAPFRRAIRRARSVSTPE